MTFRMDPRAKLYLLLLANLMLLFHVGTGAEAAATALCLLLFFLSGKARAGVQLSVLYFGLLAVDLFVVPRAGESVLLNLLSLVSVGVRMMLPCIITGAYAFSTTTVGELTAALRRMHLPESIIIPCAVVVRFFPTVGEDYRHIRAAMALRGIAAGRGALLRHPVQSLEYILMPLLMNSNNVAQDLSAAALTKGIGLPGRHTCMTELRLTAWDFLYPALCTLPLLWKVVTLLVLDEPTSNLDAAAIAQLHDMIAVMKRQGVTVVLAEHRLAWITDLADRYFFFAAGRLAAQWSAAEFAALPADTLAGYGLRARTLDDCRAGIRAKQSARCPGTPVLTLEGVTLGCDKKHPLRTLPDMSFAAGEIVGLMGRNGIGKSTMARTLCGLLEPVSGKICRNGRPANARERLRSSFLVMQDVNYQLFSDSVREEVLLGAAHPERCDAVLQALGLDGLADRHPMSLSGGQKQRVVVAAAMLSDKPLILLDEPTSGLDLGSMQQVGQLLQEWKAQGKTLLVITHDEELAANWCDRVIRWDDTEGV